MSGKVKHGYEKVLLIYRLNHNSTAQIEYFVEEALARKIANRLYTQGFYDIELFSKKEDRYQSVKRVVQDELVAQKKHDAYIKQMANAAMNLHNTLFNH